MAADDQPSDAVVGTEDTSDGEHSRANSRNGENSARSARTRAAADQIRQYRHKLLDLRNANKLLNFKHSDRGRTHIRVIDELPDELFGKLSEGKQLTFEALPEPEDNPKDERSERFLVALEEARVIDPAYLEAMSKVAEEDLEGTAAQKAERALKDRLRAQLGLPPRAHPKTMSVAEYARRHNFDPSYDLPEPGAKNLTRHQDSKVQTLLLPDDMQRKLSGVNDQARTNLQEKGVNTLYAAFGFLEWYESEQSERPLYAPLVLLPVEMTRGVVRERYRYSIRATGEELQTNITLAARLAQDFQSKLPNFDIESDTPESYFAKVKTAIGERKRWRVRRWITVGHFAFARLVMYQDLSPENWSGELGLAQHMVLGGLFGGTTVGDQVFAEEYEVDHPDVARKVPLLITDADSSQFSALVDAMDGKSMALQGPPGTGKSQTITNLIAAALASGRRVLFIAEKMAALEVVKNRLDAARLGDFILELHSTKAKKRDVLDAIAARLKVQGRVRAPTHLELDREVLGKLRKQLSSYVELVNRDVGRLGKTIQELFWAEARLRESVTLPTGISKITVPGALDYTPQKLTEMGDQLALLEGVEANFRNRYGGSERHPWRGVTKSDLTHFDQDEITRLTQDWLECCRVFNRLTSELEQDFGLESATLSETASLAQCLSVLPEVKGSDPRFLALMKPSDVRRSLINFVANLRVYRVVHEGLAQVGEAERSLAQPNLLRELFHICCVLMLNQHNVGEIGVLVAKAKADRDETAKLLDDCRHLIELFGLDERPTLKNLEPLLIAGRLLADLPDAALAVRSPTIIEPASKEKLLRGRNRANQVAEMVARWETHFRLPLKVEGVAERMRRHARPLLEAGYFSFLSSEVSDAKRYWRELRLAPSKAKTREMGRELYALAETTEAVQDFRADAWLSEICGALFVGHETDFEPLLAINRYAERVRAELSADPFQRKLRDLLLVGDKDKLAEVAVFVRSQAGERMTLGLRSHGGEGDGTLEEILHSRRLRHEGLATLSMSCEKLKLKDDLGLSNLDNLANQAFEGAAAKEAIEANEVARSALGSVFEGVNTHERGLEESVGLAEELATFALPESITAHLGLHPVRLTTS